MLASKDQQSPVEYTAVNDIFNGRYKWKRYRSNVATKYTWNVYRLSSYVAEDPIEEVKTHNPVWYQYGVDSDGIPRIIDYSESNEAEIHIIGEQRAVGLYSYEYKRGLHRLVSYISRGIDYDPDGSEYRWWIYKATPLRRRYRAGAFVTSVATASSSSYPQDGQAGNSWYKYTGQTYEYSKGAYIEDVKSSKEDQYPEGYNSIDGYWYEKII